MIIAIIIDILLTQFSFYSIRHSATFTTNTNLAISGEFWWDFKLWWWINIFITILVSFFYCISHYFLLYFTDYNLRQFCYYIWRKLLHFTSKSYYILSKYYIIFTYLLKLTAVQVLTWHSTLYQNAILYNHVIWNT